MAACCCPAADVNTRAGAIHDAHEHRGDENHADENHADRYL